MKLRSICITGVDGTGKSTMVHLLKEYFIDSDVAVQYMGLREWETHIARFVNNHRFMHKFGGLVVIPELRHRIYKYKGYEGIVIFDRYADEQYVYYKKRQSIKGRLLKCLYKIFLCDWCFSPDYYIYLTCNEQVSIARKNDIVGEDVLNMFIQNKNALDNHYLQRNNIIVIDTSKMTINETINKIIENIKF